VLSLSTILGKSWRVRWNDARNDDPKKSFFVFVARYTRVISRSKCPYNVRCVFSLCNRSLRAAFYWVYPKWTHATWPRLRAMNTVERLVKRSLPPYKETRFRVFRYSITREIPVYDILARSYGIHVCAYRQCRIYGGAIVDISSPRASIIYGGLEIYLRVKNSSTDFQYYTFMICD